MMTFIDKKQTSITYRILSGFIAFTFIFSIILPPGVSYAGILQLPMAGTMIHMSPGFVPPMVQGITIYPDNPLKFDFIINGGDDELSGDALKEESRKLIKYFLASLTVPQDELWVNLSPYEKDRIIPESFGQTEMGRDLLAQDYILKQLTASLTYPEDELGKKFWDRVYKKAKEQYGTTDIPMNTFNKVWIMPDKAAVYESGNSVFVVESHLKVMLEEDFVALRQNLGMGNSELGLETANPQSLVSSPEVISGLQSEVVREILLPELEKEVNQGKTFANLRQVFNSMLLATWYKKNLKDSLLGQIYVDKAKTAGINAEDKEFKQKIYEQYVEALQKGVFNYIREDYDPVSRENVPRKYFSGGATSFKLTDIETLKNLTPDQSRRLLTTGNIFNTMVNLIETPEATGKKVNEWQNNSIDPILEMLNKMGKSRQVKAEDVAKPDSRDNQVMTPVLEGLSVIDSGLKNNQDFNHLSRIAAKFKEHMEASLDGRTEGGVPRLLVYDKLREDEKKELASKLGIEKMFEGHSSDENMHIVKYSSRRVIHELAAQMGLPYIQCVAFVVLHEAAKRGGEQWFASLSPTGPGQGLFQELLREDNYTKERPQLIEVLKDMRLPYEGGRPADLLAKMGEFEGLNQRDVLKPGKEELDPSQATAPQFAGAILTDIDDTVLKSGETPERKWIEGLAEYIRELKKNNIAWIPMSGVAIEKLGPRILYPLAEVAPDVLSHVMFYGGDGSHRYYYDFDAGKWTTDDEFSILFSDAQGVAVIGIMAYRKALAEIYKIEDVNDPRINARIDEAIRKVEEHNEKLDAGIAPIDTKVGILGNLKQALSNRGYKAEQSETYFRGGSVSWMMLGDTSSDPYKTDLAVKTRRQLIALAQKRLEQHNSLEHLGPTGINIPFPGARGIKFVLIGNNKERSARHFVDTFGMKAEQLLFAGNELFAGGNDNMLRGIQGVTLLSVGEREDEGAINGGEGVEANQKWMDWMLAELKNGTGWEEILKKMPEVAGKERALAQLQEVDEEVDQVMQNQIPAMVNQIHEIFGLSYEEAQKIIDHNLFAEIGFDGEANRMGWWLNALSEMLGEDTFSSSKLNKTLKDAAEIRARFSDVIFSGMGGSGLSVETVKTTYGENGTGIHSLRTTDPVVLKQLEDYLIAKHGDLKTALAKLMIVVISKSLTTQETLSHLKYYAELYTKVGLNMNGHLMLVGDPGKQLPDDIQALLAEMRVEPKMRYIQLDEATDVGGRFTAPTTNVFLLPLAVAAPGRVKKILSKAYDMNKPKHLMQYIHGMPQPYVELMAQPHVGRATFIEKWKKDINEDVFLRLGAYAYHMASQLGKDKLVFMVPEELKSLPMWSEQLFEESLGKDGKGVTIIYGERLSMDELKDPENNDRVFVRFNLATNAEETDTQFAAQLKEEGYPVFDINLESIDDLGGVMLGLQKTVATIGYLWNIKFVDQPGVEGYKRNTREVLAEFEKSGKKKVEVPSGWDILSVKFDGLKVYFAPYIEAGITTEAQLQAEVAALGADMSNAAAVYAVLVKTALEKGMKVAELSSYGKMSDGFRAKMEDARFNIFTHFLKVASKLNEGPDRNHSIHQNVEYGPDQFFSTYFMPLQTEQPEALEYDDNPLRAQTIGTVKSLVEVGRKAVLITLDGKIADSEDLVKQFFAEVEGYLRQSEATFVAAAPDAVGIAPAQHEDSALGEKKGGIDLNPELFDLQIKRDGNGVPLPVNQQPIYNININGFVPIIINVVPVTNMNLLLGFTDTEDEGTSGASGQLSHKQISPFEEILKEDFCIKEEVFTEDVLV